MTQEIQKNSYLLLDSRNAPLARGELLTNPDAPTLQVRVLDHKISDVMNHEEIQLVPMGVNGAALLGRIVRSRNDNIVLEKLQSLDNDMRQNLRIPTDFRSFIYPITGRWHRSRHQPAGAAPVQNSPGAALRGGAGGRALRREICGDVQRRGDGGAGGRIQHPAPGPSAKILSGAGMAGSDIQNAYKHQQR